MSLFTTAVGRLAAVGTVGALVLGGAVLGTSAANAADPERMYGPWVTQEAIGGNLYFAWYDAGNTYPGIVVGSASPPPVAPMNAVWEMPKPDAPEGPIVNVGTGRCLTVVEGGLGIFQPIRMAPCVDGDPTQQWNVRTRGGADAATANDIIFANANRLMSASANPTTGNGSTSTMNLVGTGSTANYAAEILASLAQMQDVVVPIAPLTAIVQSWDNPGKSAVLSGTGEPGATIVVTTPTGEVSTTVNPDGTWSVTTPGLNVGWNDMPVRQEVDGETTDSTTVTVIIDAVDPAPLTAVVDSVDHDDKSAVISGTGEPGATIEIDTPTGTVTTTVDGDGTWSATAPGLAEGENELPIRQVIDGETTDSTTVTVIINVLNPPVAHPAMAGGALALALGGLLLHRRRVGKAA